METSRTVFRAKRGILSIFLRSGVSWPAAPRNRHTNAFIHDSWGGGLPSGGGNTRRFGVDQIEVVCSVLALDLSSLRRRSGIRPAGAAIDARHVHAVIRPECRWRWHEHAAAELPSGNHSSHQLRHKRRAGLHSDPDVDDHERLVDAHVSRQRVHYRSSRNRARVVETNSFQRTGSCRWLNADWAEASSPFEPC